MDSITTNSRELDSNFFKNFSLTKKILFVFFNYFTFFLLILVSITLIVLPYDLESRVVLSLTIIYLLPPLLARVALLLFPIKNSHIPFGSTEFMTWWFLSSIQTIYSRFVFLEELLRSVPSVYSLWLRLWGSKIGKMTYWSPHITVIDRSFLDIGDFVSFGMGVKLNPHVISKNNEGERELVLASIVIGDNVLLGGYSLLTAGTEIYANESTNSFLRSPPFSTWQDNKRVKKSTR